MTDELRPFTQDPGSVHEPIHHLITVEEIAPLLKEHLWALRCDCGDGLFWGSHEQDMDLVIQGHLGHGDSYEFVDTPPASITLDQAMELLAILYYDMHPHYGSTSRRGRGIGGQAITQQCNVVDPEGWEIAFTERVEHALHMYAQENDRLKPDTQRVIQALKRQARADAVTVAEADLRLTVHSNAAPYPFTKSGLIVTHVPSGIQARREVYAHSGAQQPRTQRQARLECIEEIIDKLKERILSGEA